MAVFLSQSTWGYYTQSPLFPSVSLALLNLIQSHSTWKSNLLKFAKSTSAFSYKCFKLIAQNIKIYWYFESHCIPTDIRYSIDKLSLQKAKLKLLLRSHVNASTSKTAPYVSFYCYHFAQGVCSRVSFLRFLYRGRISPACDKTRLFLRSVSVPLRFDQNPQSAGFSAPWVQPAGADDLS